MSFYVCHPMTINFYFPLLPVNKWLNNKSYMKYLFLWIKTIKNINLDDIKCISNLYCYQIFIILKAAHDSPLPDYRDTRFSHVKTKHILRSVYNFFHIHPSYKCTQIPLKLFYSSSMQVALAVITKLSARIMPILKRFSSFNVKMYINTVIGKIADTEMCKFVKLSMKETKGLGLYIR